MEQPAHPATIAIRAFHAKHGPECYADDYATFYKDGSYRENAQPYGILFDATTRDMRRPDLEYEVYSNIVKFYRLKLEEAVRQFDDLNTKLAHSIPADPDADLAELKRLQGVVQERKQELAEAEAALQQTSWGRARAARVRSDAEARQRYAEFQRQRELIRI
jgi:hypothetical protein